ncbi:MAG: hypothetical protein Tsb005_09840 [Gammaproteobacteria bacterium]
MKQLITRWYSELDFPEQGTVVIHFINNHELAYRIIDPVKQKSKA